MYAENEDLDSELRWREAVERQALKRNFEYPWNVVEIEELSKCGVWTEPLDSGESFENLNSSQHYGDLETYLRSEEISSLNDKSNHSFIEPTFYTPLKPQEEQKRFDKENFPFKSKLTPKAKKVVIPPLEVKQKTVSPQTAHVTTATFRNLEEIRESKKALDTTVSRSKPTGMYQCTESVPLVNFDLPPIDCSLAAQKPEGVEDDLRTRKNMYDTDVKQLYAGLDQFLTGVNQIREDLKSIEKESKQRLRRIGSRS